MLFEVKKIQLETLSEYLTEARKQSGLSPAEVFQQTGIQPKFLEMLEQNKFYKLPADVYVLGFLRLLGTLYTTDPEMLVNQYKKEQAIARQLEQRPLFP